MCGACHHEHIFRPTAPMRDPAAWCGQQWGRHGRPIHIHAPGHTLVILPRGLLSLGSGQFAWFRVAFTANGPGINAEGAKHNRQALVHFVLQVQLKYGIAAQDTVVANNTFAATLLILREFMHHLQFAETKIPSNQTDWTFTARFTFLALS